MEDMRPQENWAAETVLAVGVGNQAQAWDILVAPVGILLDNLGGGHLEEGRDCPDQESALLPSDQPDRAGPC